MGLVEEIQREQAHIDRAHARLDELRAGAAELGREMLSKSRGGLFSDRVERDARADYAARRRSALAIGDLPLCFGRIDTEDLERFHIGRLGVLDRDGEPLLIDWRTPVAEPFYRATPGDRQGIRRRRHIRMKAREVIGVDDESLVDPGSAEPGLVGEGALLATLARARTGRMADIVATIQTEQDRAIRSPLQGVLVVQGGPGTGKTAVALHRAAYLLYAHHFPLASQGVLVVGPNPVFCRYVEDVLPGLGETGVRLATPGGLGRTPATSVDPPSVAAVKGSDDMVALLRETVARHQTRLSSDFVVGLSVHRLVVTPRDSQALLESARRTERHNEARVTIERGLLQLLLRKAADAGRRARQAGLEVRRAAGSREELLEALRRSREVRELADRLWPVLSATQIVGEALAAAGVGGGVEETRLSEHDVALIDEAEHLLGAVPPVRRPPRRAADTPDETMERTLSGMGLLPDCPKCGAELSLSGSRLTCGTPACDYHAPAARLLSPEALQQIGEITRRVALTRRVTAAEAPLETFGHLIVDEAQDLTPMQWRMLARRCPSGSMTIVGDLGQSKRPWAPSGWDLVTALAAPERPSRMLELSVNYRTPMEIMELATALLAHAHPGLHPPASVRRSGEPPVFTRPQPGEDLEDTVRRWSHQEASLVAPGKVAIIRPADSAAVAHPSALDSDIVDLGISEAKGLEFDSVIVVEPSAFSAAELYVALTRSTRRLVILYTEALPTPLAHLSGVGS